MDLVSKKTMIMTYKLLGHHYWKDITWLKRSHIAWISIMGGGSDFRKQYDYYKCRNPTLAKCGGEAQHFQSWGLGVLRDSRMFRARQQGPKHLALGCSWCHWKGLEA